MKIEHLAIWASDLELLKDFYCTYFEIKSSEKYKNERTGFSSYFLQFNEGGARIELMNRADILENAGTRGMLERLAHIAVSVGSKEEVNRLTERLRNDGYTIKAEPRTTGDGYYESVIEDPEGNLVEITV